MLIPFTHFCTLIWVHYHTKLHMPSCNSSLISANKTKAKYAFRTEMPCRHCIFNEKKERKPSQNVHILKTLFNSLLTRNITQKLKYICNPFYMYESMVYICINSFNVQNLSKMATVIMELIYSSKKIHDSSVGTAARLWAGRPGFDSRFLLFTTAVSRPSPGPPSLLYSGCRG